MAAIHSAGAKTHAKPSNVQQIVKRAQQIDYKPLVPLRYWLRSARTLLKEVCRIGGQHMLHSQTDIPLRLKSTNVKATMSKPISYSSAMLSLYSDISRRILKLSKRITACY